MVKIYKAEEWQSGSGRWHVADTHDLANNSAVWWIPPKIFDLSYEDYIYMLIDKYNIDYLSYSLQSNVLLFSWKNHTDAHRYLLDINRIARNKNFQI